MQDITTTHKILLQHTKYYNMQDTTTTHAILQHIRLSPSFFASHAKVRWSNFLQHTRYYHNTQDTTTTQWILLHQSVNQWMNQF